MIKTACNKWVLVIRDEAETESSGLLLPTDGQVKPHCGTIQAVGWLVADPRLQGATGKKCLFHPGGGWEITYEGVVYVVVEDEKIIALP